MNTAFTPHLPRDKRTPVLNDVRPSTGQRTGLRRPLPQRAARLGRWLAATTLSTCLSAHALDASVVNGDWSCTGYNGTMHITVGGDGTSAEMIWTMPGYRATCNAKVNTGLNWVLLTDCKYPNARVNMQYTQYEANSYTFVGSWNFPAPTYEFGYPLMCAKLPSLPAAAPNASSSPNGAVSSKP